MFQIFDPDRLGFGVDDKADFDHTVLLITSDLSQDLFDDSGALVANLATNGIAFLKLGHKLPPIAWEEFPI